MTASTTRSARQDRSHTTFPAASTSAGALRALPTCRGPTVFGEQPVSVVTADHATGGGRARVRWRRPRTARRPDRPGSDGSAQRSRRGGRMGGVGAVAGDVVAVGHEREVVVALVDAGIGPEQVAAQLWELPGQRGQA